MMRPALIFALPLALTGCGARTTLQTGAESDVPPFPEAGAESSATLDGGLSDGDAAVPSMDAQDAPWEAAPMLPCVAPSPQKPLVLVSVPGQHSQAPSMAVLRKGEAGAPASVAVQVFASGGDYGHPEIRVTGLQVGQAWLPPLPVDKPQLVVGNESHGWAEMASSPSGDALAFAYHTDQGGYSRPAFKLLSTSTWSPGGLVNLAPEGEAVLALSAGAATGPMGVGYAGEGYAAVWRDYVHQGDGGVLMRPVAAVLDKAGQLVIGPHEVAPPTQYPGRTPGMTWTGATYLMGTSFRGCPYSDPLCEPRSVVISRLRPASGDAWDDSGVERVVSMTALAPEAAPGRPSLTSREDTTWAAWFEGNPDSEKAPRILRIVPLSSTGQKLAEPTTLAANVFPTTPVRLHATELGLVCTWTEEGDTSLPANQAGHARLQVLVLDEKGQLVSDVNGIATTQVDTYGWTSAVALAWPKSLVVSWTGRDMNSGFSVAWGVRLDCQ